MLNEISIAPMVDISTVYFRQLMRILSSNTIIYTEMQSASQLVKPSFNHNNLYVHNNEVPVVGQLGGNDPSTLSQAALILQSKGYSQINLNCGCPSNKVKDGCFGACLMMNPVLVRDMCSEIIKNVSIPVTVKCRLGVDDHDTYPELFNFIETVSQSGVSEFIIHARKAFLSGLSPAENRKIPPLNYPWVYELQKDFPRLKFHINGGIANHTMIKENLDRGLGVMIGRLSYDDPWFFSDVDSIYYRTENKVKSRRELLESYSYSCEQIQVNSGIRSNKSLMAKPIINLFKNQRGNANYKSELDRLSKDKTIEFSTVIEKIIEVMERANPESLNN